MIITIAVRSNFNGPYPEQSGLGGKRSEQSRRVDHELNEDMACTAKSSTGLSNSPLTRKVHMILSDGDVLTLNPQILRLQLVAELCWTKSNVVA